MNWTTRFSVVGLCLLSPIVCRAQGMGRVECPRAGDYVYLYSSMITLDVRATLQCGEQVQITGRYDAYYGVRTEKGLTGYVPLDSLLLLKDKPGPVAPSASQPVTRERTPYDAPRPPIEAAPRAPAPAQGFALHDGTAIKVKISRAISSADAKVGDRLDFVVSEGVVLDGVSVILPGAAASGYVAEAEPRKRLGRGGKLSVTIDSVRLANGEKANLRAFREGKGSNSTAGAVFPLALGKDVTFPQGAEFTAYVNGETPLKRENFHAEAPSGKGMAVSQQQVPQPR